MIRFKMSANKLTTYTLNQMKVDNTTIIQNISDTIQKEIVEIEESHKKMDENVIKILECIRNKELNKKFKLEELKQKLAIVPEEGLTD